MKKNDINNIKDDAKYEPSIGQFMNYLQSDKGNEIFQQIVTIINDIKKSILDKSSELDKLKVQLAHNERRFLIIVFFIYIIASIALIYFDKFTPPAALFLGTLIGYFFGKK